MKGICIVEKDRLDILELPEPELGPYEALVEVKACGICNSTDWKLIKGEFFSGTFPVLLGHESIGQVIEIGGKVKNFALGDLVLRSTLRDEHVSRPGGRSCWGGFVEKAIVTDVWAEKEMTYNAFPHPQQIVPASISPVLATGMITLKETLNCLNNTDVKAGHSLAIVGTGPVAQTLTLFAKLSAIVPVVVFGRQPVWAELFAKLGADAYVADDDMPPEVQAILDDGGFDRAIEAVGSQQALTRCLQIIKSDGRINLYGIAPESEPYLSAEESDPRVFRSKVAEAEEHDTILKWVHEGKIHLADWVSHEMPWTDYQRGLDMVKHKTANKVVLTFD